MNKKPSEPVAATEQPIAKEEPSTKPRKSQPAKKFPVKKKARRYSGIERSKIIRSAQAFDKAHGRGGMAHAVKKFGVTFLTLRKWLEKSKEKPAKAVVKKTRKTAPKRRIVERKKSRRRQSIAVPKSILPQKLYRSLAKIDKLKEEIAQLQQSIQKQKRAIIKLVR